MAACDPFLGKDFDQRQQGRPLLADAILYFQVIPVALLWIAFAWRLGTGLGSMSMLEIVGATVSVAFMTALGGLPAAHEMFHRDSKFAVFWGSLLATFFASSYSALAHNHVHHIETDTPEDTETEADAL